MASFSPTSSLRTCRPRGLSTSGRCACGRAGGTSSPPVKQSILANVIGADFIATHMTWGAVNEWLTHAGYSRLIEIEDHPTLTEALSRIAKQETRHIAFYATRHANDSSGAHGHGSSARRVDTRIDTLPGLEDLDLVQRRAQSICRGPR